MLTNLMSVDEFELKIVSFIGVLMIDSFNTSHDDLSSFIKFVYLSFSYACSIALAVWLIPWVCQIVLMFYVYI